MTLNNTTALLASMVGSKVASSIPRVGEVQNAIGKHVLPVIPFPIRQNEEKIEEATIEDKLDQWKTKSTKVISHFVPVSIRRAGTSNSWYQLPFEPMVSVTAKNNIVKRSIAKAPNFVGTVKEHWSQDDYQITITGILMGDEELGDFQNTYPREDVEAIRTHCTHPQGLEIRCDLLQLLGISNVVVEDFSFPFSKGENVQAFDIKCSSDYTAEFFSQIDEE